MAEDFICPICLNVMIEPVTLPCGHYLCNTCLESTLSEAAMLCPICRYRLSIWARRTRKKGSFIDEDKWRKIQELFPNYVREKLDGNLSVELTEAEEKIIQGRSKVEPRPPLADPGDLRREYELEKARDDKEREAEQAASLLLIRELEEEERELWSARQSICEADEELAKKLQMASPDASPLVLASASSSTPRISRHSWLDRFMSEKHRLHSGAGSADSIGPELGPQFRPIETFPLSPNKSGTSSAGLTAGRDCPLRPRVLPTESMKENVCSSVLVRQKSRISTGGAVVKAKTTKKTKAALGTSEGTAFRPVDAKKTRNIVQMMLQSSQEERDHQMALELQKRFDLEYKLNCTALRYKGEEDAYHLRKRSNDPR